MQVQISLKIKPKLAQKMIYLNHVHLILVERVLKKPSRRCIVEWICCCRATPAAPCRTEVVSVCMSAQDLVQNLVCKYWGVQATRHALRDTRWRKGDSRQDEFSAGLAQGPRSVLVPTGNLLFFQLAMLNARQWTWEWGSNAYDRITIGDLLRGVGST